MDSLKSELSLNIRFSAHGKRYKLISGLMGISKHTINISVAVVAVIALALVAALLPLGNSEEIFDREDLLIFEYPSRETNDASGQLGELDFKFFKLKPAKLAHDEKVETTPSGITLPKIRRTLLGRPATEEPTTISFVLVIDDATKEFYAAVDDVVQQQFAARIAALQQSSLQGCAAIANARFASDCRSEVIFQQAVLESDVQSCTKIESAELKTRCQKALG